MIRVRDPEKTVKMKEYVQAFDRRRDEQGVMRLGLYDPKSNRVMAGVARNDTLAEDTISFLAICWDVFGIAVPDVLVMDAAKIGKSLVEFLNVKGVRLHLMSSDKMDYCVPLQRVFERSLCPAVTGAMPEPATCEILQTDRSA